MLSFLHHSIYLLNQWFKPLDHTGFRGGTVVKNPPANAGNTGLNPWAKAGRALVREDPTCRGAAKPMRHSYWACALEPASHAYWPPPPKEEYWSVPFLKLVGWTEIYLFPLRSKALPPPLLPPRLRRAKGWALLYFVPRGDPFSRGGCGSGVGRHSGGGNGDSGVLTAGLAAHLPHPVAGGGEEEHTFKNAFLGRYIV